MAGITKLQTTKLWSTKTFEQEREQTLDKKIEKIEKTFVHLSNFIKRVCTPSAHAG